MFNLEIFSFKDKYAPPTPENKKYALLKA